MHRFIKHSVVIVFLNAISCILNAQNIDSLNTLLKTAKEDTAKLRLLVGISEVCDFPDIPNYTEPAITLADKLLQNKNYAASKYSILNLKAKALNNIGFLHLSQGNFKKAIPYFDKSLSIQENVLTNTTSKTEITDIKKNIASIFNNIGGIYDNLGDYTKALEFYGKGLQMQEDLLTTSHSKIQSDEMKKDIAISLNNISIVYQNQGLSQKALEYCSKSLELREEIKDKSGIAESFNNLGRIYNDQGETEKVLEFYTKGLQLHQELGDKAGMATNLNNLALIYNDKHDLKKALEYAEKALKLYEEVGDNRGISTTLNSLGIIYSGQIDVTKALDYYKRSLKLKQDIGDKRGMAHAQNNIAAIYFKIAFAAKDLSFKKKELQLAYSFSDSALVLSKKLGFSEVIRNTESTLAKIDSARGNYAGAFEHFKQFIAYRDLISNEQTRKASTKSQLKYEFDKKEAVLKEQQEKERAVAEEKSRFQQIVIAAVILGLILVIIFAAFVFRSLKITRLQKLIIEEKQREILDSIHYAKKIQNALMTSENYFERSLNKLQK